MKTFLKMLSLCALFCFALLPAHGQFINNPHFHAINPTNLNLANCATADVEFGTAPTGANPLENMCANWLTPTLGSPDYYYGCDVTNGPNFGVPTNAKFIGTCEDLNDPTSTGDARFRAYAGIYIFEDQLTSTQEREYVSQVLPQPLVVGRRYAISYWVRSSNLLGSEFIKHFGCLLTTTPVNNRLQNNTDILPKTLGDYGDAVKTAGWNSTAWQQVQVIVNITGVNKTFLTLGHFDTSDWANPATGREAYYFIDAVSIEDVTPQTPVGCPCDTLGINPPVSISLQPRANNQFGYCCWDIVVNNYGDCDLMVNGVTLAGAPLSPLVTLQAHTAGGFTLGGPGFNTIIKTPPGQQVVFAAHTSTLIGSICMGQQDSPSPAPMPILFRFRRVVAPGPPPVYGYCGNYPLELFCANRCCDGIDTVIITKAVDGNDCINTIIARRKALDSCARTMDVQSGSGNSWSTVISGQPFSNNGGNMEAAAVIHIPLGTTQHIRLVFRDADGKVVCIREFDLGCAEGECCSNIKDLVVARTSGANDTCCFHIEATIESRLPNCIFGGYVISEKQGNGWNTLLTKTFPTVPDYFMSETVCLTNNTSPQVIRIQFRDANGNVLCTRFIKVACSGMEGPIGIDKMGVNNPGELNEQGIYIVPNPAVDQATVHYRVEQESEVRLMVFDAMGRLAIEMQPGRMQPGDRHTVLPMQELSAGMYYVQVQVGSTITTVPLTVAK